MEKQTVQYRLNQSYWHWRGFKESGEFKSFHTQTEAEEYAGVKYDEQADNERLQNYTTNQNRKGNGELMEQHKVTITIETLEGDTESYYQSLEEATRRILNGNVWGKDGRNDNAFLFEVKKKSIDLKECELL